MIMFIQEAVVNTAVQLQKNTDDLFCYTYFVFTIAK